jgi:preprotein translocase subunit Sec63
MSAYHKDYYRILQVHPEASLEVIQAAYRRLARQRHPDSGGSNAAMQELNEAYEVLSDPVKRQDYDRWYAGRRPDASPEIPSPPPSPSLSTWRVLLPVVLSLLVLMVLMFDLLRLGIRGLPEVTMVLVALGWFLYHVSGWRSRRS